MRDDKDHKCDDEHSNYLAAGTETEGKTGNCSQGTDAWQNTEDHARYAVQEDADPLDQHDWQK